MERKKKCFIFNFYFNRCTHTHISKLEHYSAFKSEIGDEIKECFSTLIYDPFLMDLLSVNVCACVHECECLRVHMRV